MSTIVIFMKINVKIAESWGLGMQTLLSPTVGSFSLNFHDSHWPLNTHSNSHVTHTLSISDSCACL